MPLPYIAHSSPHVLFEFRGLEALPCGCVVADYVAMLLSLDVAAVEATGPHCTVRHRGRGSVLPLDELGSGAAAGWVSAIRVACEDSRLQLRISIGSAASLSAMTVSGWFL